LGIKSQSNHEKSKINEAHSSCLNGYAKMPNKMFILESKEAHDPLSTSQNKLANFCCILGKTTTYYSKSIFCSSCDSCPMIFLWRKNKTQRIIEREKCNCVKADKTKNSCCYACRLRGLIYKGARSPFYPLLEKLESHFDSNQSKVDQDYQNVNIFQSLNELNNNYDSSQTNSNLNQVLPDAFIDAKEIAQNSILEKDETIQINQKTDETSKENILKRLKGKSEDFATKSVEYNARPQLVERNFLKLTLCKVCEIKSAVHTSHGTFACASCRAFFAKRSVRNYFERKCINGDKMCAKDRSKIMNCTKCRYEKCIKIGMKGYSKRQHNRQSNVKSTIALNCYQNIKEEYED
jgi:hypothetical protein